ncbi:restriction endonuclease subunit S [Carnobacterium inhibens]|uniref:restriction endonuclease subunit S n=1 Tax=Carnobacterium inhibens TaxID=147709 RepID=UPI0012E00BD5|nr:restriction endonuclease subunit S [Carnobacterium inhibens]
MMEVKNEYKMTELGEIPNDWKVSRLGELADIHRGASPRPIKDPIWFSEHSSHGWVRIADVTKSSKYLFETKQYLSNEGILKSRTVKPGDLIMSICGTIGRPIIMEMDACIHDGFVAFENLKKDIDTEYLRYILTRLTNYFKAQGQPGTQVNLNTAIVEKATIPIPPLKEQQKIAEILSIVDEQIEQTDQLIKKTKELKKGLMQQLLTKGIGHTEFKKSELGEIPTEWKIFKVEDIATVSTGNKDTKDKNDDGIYPFFVRSQTIENINSYSYDGEAILTAGDGVGVGKVFHYIKGKFDFHQRVYKISDFKNMEGKYLYYYFSNNFYNQAMKYNAKTSVDSVRRDMITKMDILVPTISEQKQITSILSSVDKNIEGYEEEKGKYEELKKGLMQQLLTGKTRVKVD